MTFGTGAMSQQDGIYVRGTVTCVSGVVALAGVLRRVRIKPESFPGQRVRIKVWCGADDVEVLDLI